MAKNCFQEQMYLLKTEEKNNILKRKCLPCNKTVTGRYFGKSSVKISMLITLTSSE
jgi:hypothetical protein